MLMKPYQIIFVTFLMMGTMIACSADCWFTCWLGLEINMMSMIPLLIMSLTPMTTESAIKYFLAQAMASVLIMFSALSLNILHPEMNIMDNNILILIALLIKSGMSPFHFWFPQVMNSSGWTQCLIIITWQKIAPFVLMSYFLSLSVLTPILLFNIMTGALGGLNQTNIKTILTYSSIIHSGWLIVTIYFSLKSWMIYFLIYVFISTTLIMNFIVSGVNFSNQVMMSKWPTLMKNNFYLSLMSLGGLPPLLGFAAKITAISLIIHKMNMLLILAMVMGSLISLFYYMQLVYNLMMNNAVSMKLINNMKMNYPHQLMISLSVMGNVIMPLLVSLA